MSSRKQKLVIIFILLIVLVVVTINFGKKNQESTLMSPKDTFFSLMDENETNLDNYICKVKLNGSVIETISLDNKNNFIREKQIIGIKEFVNEGKILAEENSEDSDSFKPIEIFLASQLKKEYLEPILEEFVEETLIIDDVEYQVVVGRGNISITDLDYVPISWYEDINFWEDGNLSFEVIFDKDSKKLLEQSLVGDNNINFSYSKYDEVKLQFDSNLVSKGNYEYRNDFDTSGKINAFSRYILLKLNEINSNTCRVFTPIVVGDNFYGGFSQGVFYPMSTYNDSDDNVVNFNSIIQKGMPLHSYSAGGIAGDIVVTGLSGDFTNKIFKIEGEGIEENKFYSYLANPYPGTVEYEGDKISVDLDENGMLDEISLSVIEGESSDSLKKDIGISLNGGVKQTFTTIDSKFILVDVIDIDGDGYMEVVGFDVDKSSDKYNGLLMLKYVDGEIINSQIVKF